MKHFVETVKKDSKGRYVVRLPWLENKEVLAENKEIAEKRCLITTQKLIKEGRFADYDNVFKEWLNENIIEEVPTDELKNDAHYLPHRGVFKKDSTTNVRPVFDASCKSKNSFSLNQCLEKGPNLIEEVPPLLMRFRKREIGVVSDIRKAFLQISVAEEDQDYLRFLWWEDYPGRKFKVYRHRRVVFELTSSPFLLIAVLKLVLDENKLRFPETVRKLEKSFYVDNCITSVSDEEELMKFIRKDKEMLSNSCFDLRGWEHTSITLTNDMVKPIPVLGLLWDNHADVLFCNVENINLKGEFITRRDILSAVHRIFDPIGVLCPVTVRLKLIVQESWTLKFGWDEI
ncbi:uncharacterized protein LOC129222564 [Uloborus diversus]|uniref:uncharacterized protein LOC129222564 n=1 Tax=Uloborus diversus TaxID=327109 RepID=UPI002409E74F|nr:uncharacterized protein LOC129222564 [Uloborus diversus]